MMIMMMMNKAKTCHLTLCIHIWQRHCRKQEKGKVKVEGEVSKEIKAREEKKISYFCLPFFVFFFIFVYSKFGLVLGGIYNKVIRPVYLSIFLLCVCLSFSSSQFASRNS